jgi:3-oxoadipate enol-lactonase
MAKRLEIGELTLVYEDTGGDGPAVLFVHGLGGSAYGWWAQLAACRERGYRAIAHDQRGAGRSSKPPGPYSVESWAADAVGILDALGIEGAALVGHSVGCMVAEHAAVALGERAWALALCGGALEWPEPARPVFEQRAEMARAGRMDEIAEAVAATGLSERCRAERPELHGLMLELIASNDPDAYAEWALATAAGSMRELDRLACPVLAFAGAADPVTPTSFAEAIAAAAPDGRATTVAEAAHWCMLERPVNVSELLLDFLATAAPGAVAT